jgi:ribosomal protein L10
MPTDWCLIFSTDTILKAEMVKMTLIKNGIEAIILNKKDSSYLFGDIEVYVLSENVFAAKKIIKETNL